MWSLASLKQSFADKATHRDVWKIAAPMLLSNMTIPLVGLVDSAVMGHLEESHYLAAVGLASALFTFVIWLLGFLRMITTGLAAQAFGAKDHFAIRQWLFLPAILALILSAIILLINPWVIEVIIWWIEGSALVEQSVLDYWQVRIWGLPITLLNMVLIGWLLGMQNARLPFQVLLIINLANVVLDLFFVNILGWKVEGVALASIISELLGFLYAVFSLKGILKDFPLAKPFVIIWGKLRYLMSLNSDLLIRTLALELVFFTIHSRSAELGDELMAVNAILLNFLLVIAHGLDGLANAVESLVGRAVGEQNWKRFKAAVWVGGFWSVLISLLFVAVFAWQLELFVSWVTNIEAIKQAAEPYHIYIILVPILSVFSFWLDGVFIGGSKISAMRNSMLFAVGFGFIPLFYLSKDLANHGVWLAYYLFMLLRALMSLYYLNKGIKRGEYIKLKAMSYEREFEQRERQA